MAEWDLIVGFWRKKILKYLPLENFDQSEASIESHMTRMEASNWLKFSNGRFCMYEQLKDYFTPSQILIRVLIHYFFSKNLLKNRPKNEGMRTNSLIW